MRARTLELTAAQRAELARARDRDPRPYIRERAGALVKLAGGQSPRQVALTGLARPRRPKTVNGWLDAYTAGGLAGLTQRPRGHRGFSPLTGRGTAGDGAPGPGQLRGGARAGGWPTCARRSAGRATTRWPG